MNKMNLLLGAAAIALGAGAGFADPFDTDRPDTNRPVCTSNFNCEQDHTAFQNGYSNGYRDGIRLRQRNDRSGTGTKDNFDNDRGAAQGSYYLISI